MIESSTGAEQQLYEIRWSFQSQAALERFEMALEQAFEQLETFPESARMCIGKMSVPSWWAIIA
jgi:hypothetical protein